MSILDKAKANTPNNELPRWIALIPGGLSFLLYIITCSPTLNSTDSGELITVAWTRGIAHPPGYPLYTLLGIGISHLPIGDVAWRMNMLSAIFGGVAVGLFYLLVSDTLAGMSAFKRASTMTFARPRPAATKAARAADGGSQSRSTGKTKNMGPQATRGAVEASSSEASEPTADWGAIAGGLAASGLLAVSLTFWNWATQAKFYTLHYAFVAGLMWLALATRRALVASLASGEGMSARWPLSKWSGAIKLLHGLVFVSGLALTNHFLTFLLLPGIVILLLSPIRYARDIVRVVVRHAGTLIAALLLPLLLYLYLPIRAAMNPLIEWGLPDTLGSFWRQITAQSYQGLFGAGDIGNHFVDAVVYAANQFGPWLGALLLIPVSVGLAYLWKMDRGLFAASVASAAIMLVVVLSYNIREIVTYYVPIYMIVLWWAGLGVADGSLWVARRMSASEPQGARSTARIIGAAIAGVVVVAGLVINWGAAGHRDNYTAELFVRNAFKNFEPNAVVLTNYWDITSGSFYLQNVLGERRDVAIIDKSLMRQPFYLEYLERNYPDLIERNTGPFAYYKGLLNEWINTGRTPQGLPDAYLTVLNGFIETNLGVRPVYADFIVAGGDAQEAQEVTQLLTSRQSQLVPDGYGYRIAVGAADLKARDPQFDLRGITSDKVPLDEIESSVVALYPSSLQAVGLFMQKSSVEADKESGARLIAQAQQLEPLAERQDARPRLR